MYMTGGRWARHEKIPLSSWNPHTGKGFEDIGSDGVAGCMSWHYPKPSPPPPKNYRQGYKGYRPEEIYGNNDGALVTTTTKTTVQTRRTSESPRRKIIAPGSLNGTKELVDTKDLEVYRTEDVLPAQEYVTTTRTYLPSDLDIDNQGENIYNLQHKNGYTSNGYDNRLTNRYPLKSSLKKQGINNYRERNLDNYRGVVGYNSNLVTNGSNYREDYHSNRLTNEARNYGNNDLQTRDVTYKTLGGDVINEDTLIDVIEDLHVNGEGDGLDSRPTTLQQTRYEKTQRTVREREYPRRDLNNFDLEPEEIRQYNLTEDDVKDLWRKHRDFKNHTNGHRQVANYRGMSSREKAAMSAHHYRMQQSQRGAAPQAWGPPPPRPPSGRRPQSGRYAHAQRIGPAEKEIRFNSRADYHSYTPEDAYMDRYEDVHNKIDSWRSSNAPSRVYEGGNLYRRQQRTLRDDGDNHSWNPSAYSSKIKDITIYKPKELRYQVAAPYAEESAPREYSVFSPGTEDVKIRVQCPPSPRAKVTVNVDMDPLLD